MRAVRRSLAARLWAALSLGTLLVLGTTTLLRVVAERDLVATTMVRDRRFFGESWLAMLSRAPEGDVDRMVQALEADPLVRARHISVAIDSMEAAHARAAAMPRHQRERLGRGRVAAAPVGDQLRTLIPVTQHGSTLLIELDEPLAMSQQLAFLHSVAITGSSVALLLVAAVVTWILVQQLVARPIDTLVAHARRVGAGDLEMRLDLPDATELGGLADAMNEMTDQLVAAGGELARLESDRSSLQASLRHADRVRTAGLLETRLASLEGVRITGPDEVVQIVTNLAINAIQACEPRVRVEILARGVARDTAEGVELVVVDHGPGIDASILPHLFEPFFTTKPGDQGTGLGLSVVRGIVDERRGSLEHEETPGGGATFRVWLPSHAERSASA
ncbi:MAG: HAMP domain-containing protein [Deltaproteobacteria bacterium]|nr:HAMP domain-containing protein [Deltaproteobacteria bacterium]